MSTTTVVTAAEIAAREAAMIPVPATATAEAVKDDDDCWTVTATFLCDTPTDRPGGYAWGLRKSHARLAQRLVRAIEAGVVFTDYRIGTDINGQTYLSARNTILSRTMNADLAALGY